jgi:hypothetical protein
MYFKLVTENHLFQLLHSSSTEDLCFDTLLFLIASGLPD